MVFPRRRNGGRGAESGLSCSLELRGAPAVENLWPQPFDGKFNAQVKDRLELELHKEICDGKITMKQAQEKIRTNWIKASKKRFPEP